MTEFSISLDNEMIERLDEIARKNERRRVQQIRLWLREKLEAETAENAEAQ